MSTDALLKRLLAGVERELPHAVELRHRLHSRPELAHAEHETAKLIEGELPVACSAVAGTGRLALVGERGAAPVAVRAELDGLPISEQTGAPFAATGEAMHACGHDVHMAALVALARAAHGLGDSLPIPLLAVFQPSEEAYPSGAELLAQAELSDPAPRAILAAHIHPELDWGTVALDEGAVNASCDEFEIVLDGVPSHGAYPHLGRDPILALADAVTAINARAARVIDPTQASSLSVGVLQGGSAANVIPGRALARGAIRAHRDEDRQTLRALVEEVVAGVAAAHGCQGTVRITAGEPPLVNDPRIVAAARERLEAADLRLAPPWRSCGSDDFAFFAARAPIAMAFVGLRGAEGFLSRPLHHPELLAPDEAVGQVARTLAVLFCAACGV